MLSIGRASGRVARANCVSEARCGPSTRVSTITAASVEPASASFGHQPANQLRFSPVGAAAGHQHDLNAMTWDRDLDAARHGVIMKDGANGNDLAHEFGHFLSLPHSDESTPGNHSREDMWCCRQLMF